MENGTKKEEQQKQQQKPLTPAPAPTNGTTVPTMRPSPRPLGGLIPTSIEDLWRFGTMVFKSGFAPGGMKSPEAVCVAIQMGMEVGLSPMQAVQNIAVINGRPSVWGDAALGLVEASGLMEQFEEFEEGKRYTPDWTAVCIVKRKGRKASVRKWTWADAQRAGLDKKTGPWKEYPARMMQMRARAFNLRDNFADVLRGLSIREEAEDIIPMEQRQATGMYEATQDRLHELRRRLTQPAVEEPPSDPGPEVEEAARAIVQEVRDPDSDVLFPPTVPCPNLDGAPVPAGQCAKCKDVEGCPSQQ